jgi:hypothetical protein
MLWTAHSASLQVQTTSHRPNPPKSPKQDSLRRNLPVVALLPPPPSILAVLFDAGHRSNQITVPLLDRRVCFNEDEVSQRAT